MSQHEEVPGDRGHKPLLIRWGGWILLVLGLPSCITLPLIAFQAATAPHERLRALGVQGFTASQTSVIFLLSAMNLGLLLLLGFGLLRDRKWARPLGTLFWLGPGIAYGATQALLLSDQRYVVWGLISGLLYTGIAGWYFYGKASVRAYYERLRMNDSP